MSLARAQRRYDNQSPPECGPGCDCGDCAFSPPPVYIRINARKRLSIQRTATGRHFALIAINRPALPGGAARRGGVGDLSQTNQEK